MFKNYFLTACRHILKSKVSFALKLGGLTLALVGFLVIGIYISFQLSFDKYHENYENIYRVNSERKEDGKQEKYAIVPRTFGALIRNQFPEIVSSARIRGTNQSHIRFKEKAFSCNIVQTDPSFFDVFTVKFHEGETDALKRPGTIVLTKSMADKIFGDEDPLHQVVALTNKNRLVEVTAVIEDFPANSHLSAEAIIPINNDNELFSIDNIISPVKFVDESATLYLRLHDKSEPASFGPKLEALLDRHINKKERLAAGFHISLQSLQSIYMSPALKYDVSKKGSAFYLYAFSILGIFLLVIASVSYINLSIADYNTRWREIGVRKVMGARKSQIAFQVITESVFYVFASLIASIGILYFLFPKVLELLDSNLRFGMLLNIEVISTVGITIIVLILFSTAFPAYQFASSTPSVSLRSGHSSGYNSSLSKILLSVQFIISILCISATIIVGRQLNFIHTKDLGFDRKNLIVLVVPENFSVENMRSLKNEIKTIPGVVAVSNSSFKVGGGYWKDWYTIEIDGQMKSMELYEVFSDDELFSTLGMKLIEGRLFNASNPADSASAFVINETAARELGWKNPIGKRILTHPEEPGRWEGTVVGVVKDINISTLHKTVKPLVMRLPWQNDYPEYFVYVRLEGQSKDTIKSIEKKYSTLFPGYPLDYDDVDSFFNGRYQNENKAFGYLLFATTIIVLISSLGIFSLSIYLSMRRMKEFGIRKVLGATARQITFLHVSHFLKIAILANLIALPIAYWYLRGWLNEFAYRIELKSFSFVSTAMISLLMVIIAASYSSWKAGRMNPVDAIKME